MTEQQHTQTFITPKKWLTIAIVICVSVVVWQGFVSYQKHQHARLLLEQQARAKQYPPIKWQNLLPEKELQALSKGQSNVDIKEGSREDTIASQLSMKIDNPKNEFEKALISTAIRPEYHNKKIKLAGFIVPTDIQGEGLTKEFFFVPFFGACLHLPPPPPNQIVYAKFPQGLQLRSLKEPHYIEATLQTKVLSNGVVTSAYTAQVDYVTSYYAQKIQ